MNNQAIKICSKCKKEKPHNADHFKVKGNKGTLSQVCKACLQQLSESYTAKKREAFDAEKENRSDDTEEEDDDALELTVLTLEVFLNTISSAQNLVSFTALVDLSAMTGSGDRVQRAKDLAKLIWEHSNYRFMFVDSQNQFQSTLLNLYHFSYHTARAMTKRPATRVRFHCAQHETRQHEPKKGLTGGKQREKRQMHTFQCNGWLHITIADDLNTASVKYNHEDNHVPYCNVQVPQDIQVFIENNLSMTPTQVRILQFRSFCILIQPQTVMGRDPKGTSGTRLYAKISIPDLEQPLQ
jgi:hypothetical protein